jgi:hypothetical protein
VRLSAQQKAVLSALSASSGWLPVEALHAARYGVSPRTKDRAAPLTGSQRASLSRTLRRLERAGLVSRPDRRRAWWITAAGREAHRLTNVANRTQTLTAGETSE